MSLPIGPGEDGQELRREVIDDYGKRSRSRSRSRSLGFTRKALPGLELIDKKLFSIQVPN